MTKKISDYEYLKLVANSFKMFKECPIHGNISAEIMRIAEKLKQLEEKEEK